MGCSLVFFRNGPKLKNERFFFGAGGGVAEDCVRRFSEVIGLPNRDDFRNGNRLGGAELAAAGVLGPPPEAG